MTNTLALENQKETLIAYLFQTIEQQAQLIERQKEEILLMQTSSKPQATSSMKLTQLLIEWLEIHKPCIQENTYHTYFGELTRHLIPYFTETNAKLNKVTHLDIEEFYSVKLFEGLSPNTIIRFHAFLFSAFKYAEEKEYVLKNPMRLTKRPKEVLFIPNVLDAEQVKQLFISTRHLKIYPAIILAATLGLRRSEIAALKWEFINFNTGVITIKQKTISVNSKDYDLKRLKTFTSYRSLKLPDITIEFLKTLKRKQELLKSVCKKKEIQKNFNYVLLDNKGRRITLERITGSFRDFIDSNLEYYSKVRFHDLRHSCACILLNNGCNMKQVQEWLGHSNFAFTAKVYIHLTAKEKEYAATRLDEALKQDFDLSV